MIAEFSITPIGAGVSLSKHIAKASRIVEQSGVKHELHAMGTILEGEWDEILSVIRRCHDAVQEDVDRVSVLIKIDSRKDVKATMEGKLRSVERRLRDE